MPEPTYSDYLPLRKSDDAPPRAPTEDTTRVYADSGGALRTIQSDGTDAPVAGAGVLPNPTDDGDVLTVVEGEWAGAPSSGGSQSIDVVRVPITFDMAGLNLPNFVIAGVNQGAKTFEIEAQGLAYVEDEFSPGGSISVTGSTGNDATYTVVSSAYDTGPENILVVVAEAIPDATADGFAVRPGPVGIRLCDLAIGDVLVGDTVAGSWISFVSLPTEWDLGVLCVTVTAGRGDLPDTPPDFGLGSPQPLTTPNDDAFSDFPGTLTAPVSATQFDANRGPVIAQQETALWVCVAAAGGTEYPYATQGEGEIVLFIARAA